jgi:hypothetical protein
MFIFGCQPGLESEYSLLFETNTVHFNILCREMQPFSERPAVTPFFAMLDV